MSVIYLIRHGQASFAEADYDALSPLGFDQARLLGEQLARIELQPTRIMAGAMRRHRETCSTALNAMDLPDKWVTDARLNEYDHEDVITQHWPLFADRAGMANWFAKQDSPKKAFKDIFFESIDCWQKNEHNYKENWDSFCQRVRTGFDEIRHLSGTTLVFTSGGVISVILKQLLNLSDSSFQTFSATLVNSGITRLVNRNGHLQLASFNEQLHLPKAKISYR